MSPIELEFFIVLLHESFYPHIYLLFFDIGSYAMLR